MELCENCRGASRTLDHNSNKPVVEQKEEKCKPYKFEKLESQSGCIRTLVLRSSGRDTPEVDCELETIRFSKDERPSHPYEALSWCWGGLKHDAPVYIRKDGKRYVMKVSPELVAALKALRYTRKDRRLWVDAICIDQSNNNEKNHQVEMMSDIYGKARRVCIWLGEGDESSDIAIKFIREEVLKLQNFDELCANDKNTKKWGALLELMQRPWFSRRWVVQEIALARQAVVHCGSHKMPWKKFAVAVELFVEVESATHRLSEVMKKDPQFYHVPGWFEYVSALGASLLVEATGKLFRDYKPNRPENGYDLEVYQSESSESEEDSDFSDVESLPGYTSTIQNEVQSTFVTRRGQPLLSLEYLVSSLSIFNTTVPHDSIYALLAIAKDTTPSADADDSELVLDHTQNVLEVFVQKKRYKVEYQRVFADVCKDFILFCIEHSDQSRALDILCRPWAPEPPKGLKNGRPIRGTAASSPKERGRRSMNKSNTRNSNKSTKPSKRRESAPLPLTDAEMEDKRIKEEKEAEREKEDVPLPSWIPKLSGAAYDMYSQPGVHTRKMGRKNADTLVGLPPSNQSLQRNYNAAQTKGIDMKTLRFRKRIESRHYSMYVRGFVLDTIVDVQPSSQGGAIPREWADAGGWEHVPDDDPPNEFWRTLVADRGRDGRNPPVYYSSACKESFSKGGLSSGVVNTTDLINNERCSVVAQFCRRVQAVIWNRSLIKTDKTKRLGLAAQNTQPSDLVCILYGCSVPVVLRQKEKTLPEIKLEVQEDVSHWGKTIKARLRRNCKRNLVFRNKRDTEKSQYEKWHKFMYLRYIEHLNPQLTKIMKSPQKVPRKKPVGYSGPHTSAATTTSRMTLDLSQSGSTSERFSRSATLLTSENHTMVLSGHQEEDTQVGNAMVNGVPTESPPSTPTSPGHAQPTWEQNQWPASDPELNALNGQRQSGETLSPQSNTTNNGSNGISPNLPVTILSAPIKRVPFTSTETRSVKYSDIISRMEPEEYSIFMAWQKVNAKALQNCSDAPRKPNVDWYEFEICLKFGRRWKNLVSLRKQLATWVALRGGFQSKPKPPSRPPPKERRQRKEAISKTYAKMFLVIMAYQYQKNPGYTYKELGFQRAYVRHFLQLRDYFTGIHKQPLPARGEKTWTAYMEIPEVRRYMTKYEDGVKRYLEEKFAGKFKLKVEPQKLPKHPDPEAIETYKSERKKTYEHNKRVEDNKSYYEFLGECYVHGMMDGEAMAYQNDNIIRAQVFELR